MQFTNRHNIDMTLAVFLAYDDYDGINQDKSISVTTLLKPVREIILGSRVPPGSTSVDISSLIASSLGTAIHSQIEKAWLNNPQQTLQNLGYPKAVYSKLRINPPDNDEDYFNVFIEQRTTMEFMGFKINGKFDFIIDGVVEDVKSTGVFSWIRRKNDNKYKLQCGLYRLLNPELATEDFMKIHFVFTDWSKLESIKNPKNYPPLRVMTRQFKAMAETDVRTWLAKKLTTLQSLWDADESALPLCTPEELWQDDPAFKWYKTGNTSSRATAVSKDYAVVERKRRESGGLGVILPVYGKPKACLYCSAFTKCSQGKGYVASGQIDLEN